MERFRISVTLNKQVEFEKRPLKGKFGKMSLKIHFMLLHISLPHLLLCHLALVQMLGPKETLSCTVS